MDETLPEALRHPSAVAHGQPARNVRNGRNDPHEANRNLIRQSLVRRNRAELRFRLYGLAAIGFGLLALGTLFSTIFVKGASAFQVAELRLSVDLDLEVLEIDDPSDAEQLSYGNYMEAIRAGLRALFPDAQTREQRRRLNALLDPSAEFQLREAVIENPRLLGATHEVWLHAGAAAAQAARLGEPGPLAAATGAKTRQWVARLLDENRMRMRFNGDFFFASDSRSPGSAGIFGALKGSLLTMLVTFLLSFPAGIAAAIYLETLAPRNRLTDWIEINISNMAAVPSIIFGLLGLAVFINWFNMPRAAPLAGGMILALMTMPTIIISSRAALASVPPSIRDAALAVGASPTQATLHHVIPVALPGMLTGSIVGMAQALGETAPLLMIGMVAFMSNPPQGLLEPATVLPVQIFLWADSPEAGFVERAAGAIIVLLGFLIVMNAGAILLRNRLQKDL